MVQTDFSGTQVIEVREVAVALMQGHESSRPGSATLIPHACQYLHIQVIGWPSPEGAVASNRLTYSLWPKTWNERTVRLGSGCAHAIYVRPAGLESTARSWRWLSHAEFRRLMLFPGADDLHKPGSGIELRLRKTSKPCLGGVLQRWRCALGLGSGSSALRVVHTGRVSY